MSEADDFPKHKYQWVTLRKLDYLPYSGRMKILRAAASGFTSKKAVREYIFQHKGTSCYICGGEATQIDHKISVYRFAENKKLDVLMMNSYDNLFPICKHCNSKKSP